MADLYREAAEVLREALSKRRSIRGAVYASGFRNKKRLLRLCCETLRCRIHLDKIMEIKEVQDLLKMDQFDCCLLYVLLYDYAFGQGLQKARKIYAAPLLQRAAYIDQQLATMKDIIHQMEANAQNSAVLIPRYARINTLRWSVGDAVQALQSEGWSVSNMEPQKDVNWYRNTVLSMTEHQIYIDYHVKTLLIFPPNTDLHQYWMVVDGYLLLQDKASCLPSHILKPKLGSHIFDVCAAPGMKTTHLAALTQNEGKIWAIDKAGDRVETMREIVNKAGATNISIFCGDFLRTDVTDRKFSKVQYALVDPPCSGSGIMKRMDELIDGAARRNCKRLRSLSNLQAMLLKHTMKLPNLKKVVYSTCSVYEEENEKVIEEILNDELLKEKFELASVMPKWQHRGNINYMFGNKCLRALPEIDLTNGFFIALFKKRKS